MTVVLLHRMVGHHRQVHKVRLQETVNEIKNFLYKSVFIGHKKLSSIAINVRQNDLGYRRQIIDENSNDFCFLQLNWTHGSFEKAYTL